MKKITMITALVGLIAGPAVAETDWTGFYAGVSAGQVTSDTNLVFVPGATGAEDTVLGGFAGYNLDFGTIVVGGELEYGMGTSGTGTFYSLDSIMNIKARVGYDAGPVLVYGVGAYTQVLMGSNVSPFQADSEAFSYGAGIEYRLNNNWSLGAEYLSYNDDNYSASGDIELQTFTARVSYAF